MPKATLSDVPNVVVMRCSPRTSMTAPSRNALRWKSKPANESGAPDAEPSVERPRVDAKDGTPVRLERTVLEGGRSGTRLSASEGGRAASVTRIGTPSANGACIVSLTAACVTLCADSESNREPND